MNDAVRGGTPDAAPLAECLHRLLILRDDVDALSEKKAVARQHKTGAARPPAAKGPAQRKQQRRPPSQNNARARRRAERAASPAVQARKEAHAERRDRARTMEAAARAHREYVPASPSAASSAPASMDQDLDSPSHGPGPEQAHEPSGADPSQEGGAAPAPQDAEGTVPPREALPAVRSAFERTQQRTSRRETKLFTRLFCCNRCDQRRGGVLFCINGDIGVDVNVCF